MILRAWSVCAFGVRYSTNLLDELIPDGRVEKYHSARLVQQFRTRAQVFMVAPAVCGAIRLQTARCAPQFVCALSSCIEMRAIERR